MPTPKNTASSPEKKKLGVSLVKFVYLYLMTLVGIILLVISTIGFFGLGLKEYVLDVKDYSAFDEPYECMDDSLLYTFNDKGIRISKYPDMSTEELDKKKADCTKDAKERNEARHTNDVKRVLAEFIAMFIVALPLYSYHWGLIKKNNKKS